MDKKLAKAVRQLEWTLALADASDDPGDLTLPGYFHNFRPRLGRTDSENETVKKHLRVLLDFVKTSTGWDEG